MSVSFDDSGYKQLSVHVVVHSSSGGQQTYEYPLYVTVEEPDEALLSFSTEEIAAGETELVNVTLANGHDDPITGIQVDLNSSGSVIDGERITGSVAPGSERTFQYNATFDDLREGTLTGTVTYTTAEGITRTTTESTRVAVTEPVVRADLSTLSSATENDSTRVALANLGNTDFTDVVLTAENNGSVITRTAVREVVDGARRSVTMDVGSTTDGTITYTARYTAAGTSHTTTLQSDSEIAGEIQLSAVESMGIGSTVTLDGDAANLGSTDAESVVLRVPDTDAAEPSGSAGEYFVGTIEASEFATFELSADVSADADAVPIELSYIVDGNRVTATQQVEVSTAPVGNGSAGRASGPAGASGPPGASSGPSGGTPPSSNAGPPLGMIGLVVAVLVIGGGGYAAYRWRQQ
jgi:hypothetical protein